jgi:hypothetical protein
MYVTFDPQGTQAPGDSGVTIRVATYVTSTSCREDEIPAPPAPHTLKTSLLNETTAVHATTRSKWRLISCKMLSNVIGSYVQFRKVTKVTLTQARASP